MKKKEKVTTYVIWKGDMMKEGVAVKMRAIEGVLEFLRLADAAEYRDGRHTYLVVSKGGPGDASYLAHTCVTEGDLVGATGHRGAEERAQRCFERYKATEGAEGKAGHLLLKHYLDRWYMTYDSWEE